MDIQINTPILYVCPGYKTLCPNVHSPNPTDLLQGLPLFTTLRYVIERQAKNQYSFGNLDKEKELLYDVYLP